MGATQNYPILIIDDKADVRRAVTEQLQDAGFVSVSSSTSTEALALIRERAPNLVLLNLALTETNALELCRTIRAEYGVPLIILTEKDSEQDKVDALMAGADDYVVNPFSIRELAARITAVLRRANAEPVPTTLPSGRSSPESAGVLQAGDMRLELTTCRVSVGSSVKTLTPNEFRLLAIFMRTPGEVFTREDLRRRVWPNDQHSLHLVEVHIANLRAKIESDPHHPQHIVTVRSRGYKFIAS